MPSQFEMIEPHPPAEPQVPDATAPVHLDTESWMHNALDVRVSY